MTIGVGERLPEATLTVMNDNKPEARSSLSLFGSGRVVLFSVPGPFTPTCSVKHLPGFLEQAPALLEAGVDQIACMSVNDIFVLNAWARASDVNGRVLMAADGNGDFTRALGLELDGRAFNMGWRSKRFAMIIENGVVRHLLVDAPGEFRLSSAEHVLGLLRQAA